MVSQPLLCLLNLPPDSSLVQVVKLPFEKFYGMHRSAGSRSKTPIWRAMGHRYPILKTQRAIDKLLDQVLTA